MGRGGVAASEIAAAGQTSDWSAADTAVVCSKLRRMGGRASKMRAALRPLPKQVPGPVSSVAGRSRCVLAATASAWTQHGRRGVQGARLLVGGRSCSRPVLGAERRMRRRADGECCVCRGGCCLSCCCTAKWKRAACSESHLLSLPGLGRCDGPIRTNRVSSESSGGSLAISGSAARNDIFSARWGLWLHLATTILCRRQTARAGRTEAGKRADSSTRCTSRGADFTVQPSLVRDGDLQRLQ